MFVPFQNLTIINILSVLLRDIMKSLHTFIKTFMPLKTYLKKMQQFWYICTFIQFPVHKIKTTFCSRMFHFFIEL